MLYHRDPFLHWIGELVGLHYVHDRRMPLGSDTNLPIILVTGVPGSGRSSLLGALAVRYRNRTPLGYVDLAEPRPAGAIAGADPSSLIPILDSLVWDFTRRTRDTGQLRLPRLMLALFTLALWPPGHGLTPPQAEALAKKASKQLSGWFGGEQGRRLAGRLLAALLRAIPTLGLPVPGPVGVLSAEGVRIFVDEVLTRGQGHAVRSWWQRHLPNEPGTGAQKVLGVARDFHRGGDWRTRAERNLVAALLADLTAEFGADRRFRLRRPLLLIDNVDRDPAGTALLELVLKNRQVATDPLVLVGSALPGHAARWPDARTVALDEVPAKPARPASLVVVPLDPLREAEDTLEVFDERYRLDSVEPSNEPQAEMPRLVHRLADGLPLAVGALAAAVARQAGHGGVDPWELLDLPVLGAAPGEPDVSVAEYLLPLLVPDTGVRDDLVLFAAAQDAAAARVLANWYLPKGRRAVAVEAVERFLREQTRPRTGTGFLVGDTLVRMVLLHRLRACGTAAGPGWDEVHGCLHAHYAGANPGGPGTGPFGREEPSRLRHALSLGHEQRVADRFSTAFGSSGQRAWLDALVFVSTAPPASRLTRLAGQDDPADPDRAHRAIARLVHNAWYLSDPRTPPDRAAIGRLYDDLRVLAADHPSDGQIFFDAATNWSQSLTAWRQDSEWLDTGGETS